MIDRVGSRLDLDDAQKAKLGALADQLRAQRQALVGRHRPAQPRSSRWWRATPSTAPRPRPSSTARRRRFKRKSPELIAAVGDFYDSLRPEQQQKVRDFMSRGHHGWGH